MLTMKGHMTMKGTICLSAAAGEPPPTTTTTPTTIATITSYPYSIPPHRILPHPIPSHPIRMAERTTCEECEETDSVAEGVKTPRPPERHSGCTRDREGKVRVKRGSNTLWQATCHQEVPRYRHPVAIVLAATSNDKGRLYDRGIAIGGTCD